MIRPSRSRRLAHSLVPGRIATVTVMQYPSPVLAVPGPSFLTFAICVALFAGCAQGPTPPAAPALVPQARGAQLIIKFRPSSNVTPAQADVLAGLSRDAGVRLAYVRSMSGDTHVLRAENVVGPQELALIIERLSKRADVAYVEEDVRMYHQKNQ